MVRRVESDEHRERETLDLTDESGKAVWLTMLQASWDQSGQ